MTTRRLLFLLGGSPAFDVTAEEFVSASGGSDATVALLLQGGRGWEKYVPEYVQPWMRRGVSRYDVIVPGEHGLLNPGAVSNKLRQATGIFIGGGHTPTYQRLYATEPVRTILRERYDAGVPIAGVSAGALIAAEICPLYHDETADGTLEIVAGLGLISNVVLGVHFTESNALPGLLEAISKTRTSRGWGIDEPAGVVCEDSEFRRVLGRAVYEVTMTDFGTKDYRINEL